MSSENLNLNFDKLQNEDFNNFHGDKLLCNNCKLEFGILKNYIGIINCPYCNEYVEGM